MPGKIFVNYRRDDVPGDARGVRDGLAAKFGKSSIFMDVDNLLVGQRFDIELAKALDDCDMLIAVIGPRWLDLLKARSAAGERDYVREEIAEALKRKIAVVPVRVGREGSMPALPRPEELPEDIRELVLYQKHDVAHERFGRDMAELVTSVLTLRKAMSAGKRPGPARAVPLGWIAASMLTTLGAAYAGAYYAGVPVPWPWSPPVQQGPSAAEIAVEKARTESAERERVAAAEIEKERQARTKAEAEAAAVRRELEARQKAEVEAKRKADEAERLRLAALKAEEDRQRAAAEAKRKADEEAARRDPALSVKPGSGQRFRDCPSCPDMLVAPSGEFMMGSTPGEIDAASKERPDLAQYFKGEGPRHKVSIARPFAVGRTHITRGEFAAFVTATGHKTDGGCHSWDGKEWKLDTARSWRSPGFEQTDAHPVVCVNWQEATAYAGWLSKATGKSYRLLSEAEAEYVTRATTQATSQPRFFFGNGYNDLCAHGNGADRSGAAKLNWDLKTVAPCDDGYAFTAPVASFKANPWGLHDVHGNAWSWTADCFVDGYNGAPSDGSARTDGGCVSRVRRGGSWSNIPDNLRSARRDNLQPGIRNDNIGFRLARTLNPSP